jgi:arginase
MSSRPITVVSAPLDCSGRGRGEEAGSAALVDAGFARLSDAAVEHLDIRIRDVHRDPGTGVLAHAPIAAASHEIAGRVEAVLTGGRMPVVVGGDCTVLVGALSGARRAGQAPALVFLDGHADALSPDASPTGETADMDFGIVTGTVDVGLTGDAAPLVAPDDAVLIGYRRGEALEGGGHEIDLVDARVRRWSADEVLAAGAAAVGTRLARQLRDDQPLWLHLDVDVFDPEIFPAVTYPEPGGLSFDDVAALLAPILATAPVLGITVADYVADADPTGRDARRLADWFADIVT